MTRGTKTAILAAFHKELKLYPWASDEAKLERFMQAARETLDGGNLIDRSGHAWQRALELNGIFGTKAQALKRLHDLPA